MALYLQLFSRQVPRTVIEIGTRFGGSALWFADMMDNHGVAANVISIDIVRPEGLEDSRIRLIKGDAANLTDALDERTLTAPHPWLVVEDSSHMYEDSIAVLRFFHDHLQSNDYIVIEDGIVAFMDEAIYGKYESGPTCAVEDFLKENPGQYELDTELCDFFGKNVTYNPNGWLRKL